MAWVPPNPFNPMDVSSFTGGYDASRDEASSALGITNYTYNSNFKDYDKNSALGYSGIKNADDFMAYAREHLDDPATRDLYFSYLLSEQSANSAYNRELQADSTKYQRLANDLTKAGINPLYALSGASAGSVSSSGSSFSSGYRAQYDSEASRRVNTQNKQMDVLKGIGVGLASAAAVIIAGLIKFA